MLQIVIFLEFWVVFAVSFFLGNPVKYSSTNENLKKVALEKVETEFALKMSSF